MNLHFKVLFANITNIFIAVLFGSYFKNSKTLSNFCKFYLFICLQILFIHLRKIVYILCRVLWSWKTFLHPVVFFNPDVSLLTSFFQMRWLETIVVTFIIGKWKRSLKTRFQGKKTSHLPFLDYLAGKLKNLEFLNDSLFKLSELYVMI